MKEDASLIHTETFTQRGGRLSVIATSLVGRNWLTGAKRVRALIQQGADRSGVTLRLDTGVWGQPHRLIERYHQSVLVVR